MNRLIKKYYLSTAAMVLGGLLIAGTVNLMVRPVYQAKAVIRINTAGTSPGSLSGGQPAVGEVRPGFKIGTYTEILKSRAVLEAVLNKTRADNQVLTYESFTGPGSGQLLVAGKTAIINCGGEQGGANSGGYSVA